MKKLISVLIPCYNEEDNVIPMSEAVREQFETHLPDYDFELIFIDNCSQDATRSRLLQVCEADKRVKAIFNAKNFGQFNSPFHGMRQTHGDCTITMCCDFQDPPELIPRLVQEWEKGFKIVCAIKTTSRESPLVRLLRTCYYKLIKKISPVEMIEHFTGTGLYDHSFINVLRELDDPTPFLRGIVGELGFQRTEISYEQQKRRAGKTHNNLFTLYDAAMLSFTSYTKAGMRLATISGFVIAFLSVLVAIVYTTLKLLYWNRFPAGNAPILIGVFLFGGIQLFFTGLLGEYIMNINTRMMHRPLVIEERRINFEETEN